MAEVRKNGGALLMANLIFLEETAKNGALSRTASRRPPLLTKQNGPPRGRPVRAFGSPTNRSANRTHGRPAQATHRHHGHSEGNGIHFADLLTNMSDARPV